MLTEDNILRFCQQERMRGNDLSLPWIEDGKLYSTNGNVAMSCDPSLYNGELNEGKHPQLQQVFAPIGDITKWKRLPPRPRCRKCHGHGRYIESDWDGEENVITCVECAITLAGRRITRQTMQPILLIADCSWGVVKQDGDSNVFFRFDEGTAVAAPLTRGM